MKRFYLILIATVAVAMTIGVVALAGGDDEIRDVECTSCPREGLIQVPRPPAPVPCPPTTELPNGQICFLLPVGGLGPCVYSCT